jgi:Flp pilus assembly protein TadG
MTGACRRLLRDCRAAAAAEMALVLPLLLAILFGSLELGNFFMNEHTLVKAVRDGARFAARQSFTNYTACSGAPGGSVVADTRNVVMNGYLAGGTIITPNIQASDISVTTTCMTSAGGQTMSGIYVGRDVDGDSQIDAQIVTVSATVSYRPVLAAFGFRGVGLNLNAASQAAVAGA